MQSFMVPMPWVRTKEKGEGDSELHAFKISSDGEKNEVLGEQQIH